MNKIKDKTSLPKLTRTEGKLLFFARESYHYDTVKGYSFNVELKCGGKLECFTYKLKNEWYVNDNEGHLTNIHKYAKTRRQAIDFVCDKLGKKERTEIDKAFEQLDEKRENELKKRVELVEKE